MVRRLARKCLRLEFVYEAGSCGYRIQRQLSALGHACRFCEPSLTPRKLGDRVKNDKRDAIHWRAYCAQRTSSVVVDTEHGAVRQRQFDPLTRRFR